MTPLLPLNNIYAISVPENITALTFYGMGIYADELKGLIFKVVEDNPITKSWSVKLSPGNYEYMFCSLSCTEVEAGKVVEGEKGAYYDYAFGECPPYLRRRLDTATSSLNSLLRANGLDEKNNYAIIKKLK